jgi:fumarate reductase subunit D
MAIVHRLSGVLLACFLPLHFLVLGLAIEGEAHLDQFLRWTDRLPVKVAETALVFLLAVHLIGGFRLLVIENLPWRDGQKQMALGGLILAALVGLVFVTGVL